MKSTGMVRVIDQLGRLTMPKELREMLGMLEGAPLEIFVDGNTLILKKYQPGCIFCGNVDGVIQFKGKNICPDCLKEF